MARHVVLGCGTGRHGHREPTWSPGARTSRGDPSGGGPDGAEQGAGGRRRRGCAHRVVRGGGRHLQRPQPREVPRVAGDVAAAGRLDPHRRRAHRAVVAVVDNLYAFGPVDVPMSAALPDRPSSTKGTIRMRMWHDLLAASRAADPWGRRRARLGLRRAGALLTEHARLPADRRGQAGVRPRRPRRPAHLDQPRRRRSTARQGGARPGRVGALLDRAERTRRSRCASSRRGRRASPGWPPVRGSAPCRQPSCRRSDCSNPRCAPRRDGLPVPPAVPPRLLGDRGPVRRRLHPARRFPAAEPRRRRPPTGGRTSAIRDLAGRSAVGEEVRRRSPPS